MPGTGDGARAAAAETALVHVHGYLCLSPRAYWAAFLPAPLWARRAGVDIVVAGMPRTGDVERHAAKLARQLAHLPHRRLVLVGHSMGGLDARMVASRLDPQRRIRTVLTIGTPHQGSPAAEWVLANRRRWPVSLLRLIDRGALRDLTREGALRLERLMPDRPDVDYLALGGSYPLSQLSPAFQEVAARVETAEQGPSDGFVPLSSALRWQGALTVNAHHLGLIGLPLRPEDRRVATAPATRILLSRMGGRQSPPTCMHRAASACRERNCAALP
jgi:triacylglycerol lipase